MAKLLQAAFVGRDRDGGRSGARNAPDGNHVQEVRCAPRARFRGRSQTDWTTVLRQLGFAEIREEGQVVGCTRGRRRYLKRRFLSSRQRKLGGTVVTSCCP